MSTLLFSLFFNNTIVAALPGNVQLSTLLAVLLLLLVFISFSLSGSQGAVFSLGEGDVDVLKTKQRPAAKRIISLLNEPKEVFTSILIAKTVINICIIIIANYLLVSYLPDEYQHGWYAVLKYAVIAFLLIFVVEIFPRVWATKNNLRFAYEWPFLIWITEVTHLALNKISYAVVNIAEGVGRGIGADKAEENSIQELDEAIDVQTDDKVSPQEKNIMKGIVKFGNISVRKVMRSRLYVSGIEHETSFEDLIKEIEELHYSRLPIYKESMDNVVGILNTKDILAHIDAVNFDWRTLIRPPYFVPESKLIEDLLIDFQKKRIHFAVVVDEFGGTSGIITMEDIIEEVIGDIKDEFDEEEDVAEKLDDNTYIFEGRTMLHDMCKVMKIPVETFDAVKGESESVGGLVNELSGEIPKQGDSFTTGDFEFNVLEVEKNRVKTVKVIIH